MACFCTSVELRDFLLIFIIVTLSSCVNCRNEKTETTWSNVQEAIKEKGKAPNAEKQRRDALMNRYRMQQSRKFTEHCWAIHYISFSQSHGWVISWTMLISTGDLTLKLRSSRKQYVYKILKLILGEGKAAKGEKRTRKARIKELRQFLTRESRIAEKIAQKAKSLTA